MSKETVTDFTQLLYRLLPLFLVLLEINWTYLKSHVEMKTSTKRSMYMSQNTILVLPTIQMMTVIVMNMIIIIRIMIQSQHQIL